MRRALIPNPPRPYLFPLRSIIQPAAFPTPYSVRAQFSSDSQHFESQSSTEPRSSRDPKVKGHKVQEWRGSSTEDHATNRAAKNDITDPEVEGVAKGQKEREESAGIADATKSSATTQRDLGQNKKKAKEEHPKAPEPVIGMNDERGSVSHFCPPMILRISFQMLTFTSIEGLMNAIHLLDLRSHLQSFGLCIH